MRKALQMLGVLDDLDIEWLIGHARIQTVKTASVLIREGEPIDALYILVEGKMSVRSGRSGNKEIATLFPGEIVGEISFVDSRPPAASVIAAQNSRVLGVPTLLIRGKLERDTGFAARFYRAVANFLADRLRTTTARLGYGKSDQEQDVDELDTDMLDNISVAATRFDHIMKRLQMSA